MSCCGEGRETGSCVCNVLKDIARAQQDVVESCCDTSCEKAISDLLGETEVINGLNTVPVLLYCTDGCVPFKGYGADARDIGCIVSSHFFRVKSVSDDCCAVLELLREPDDHNKCPHNPCEQATGYLRTTGICITVDVKCFCHITCLPAIAAF